MAKRSTKPLTKKEQALADSWDQIKRSHESVSAFAGKYKKIAKPVRTKKLKMEQVFTPPIRQQDLTGFVIQSVPMGNGGTVPYDITLEEAKRELAWRTGPLYNKGGPAYLGDEDLKDVKAGLTRRRP